MGDSGGDVFRLAEEKDSLYIGYASGLVATDLVREVDG